MADFLAIISNVKIIKCLRGDAPRFEADNFYDKLGDVFPPTDIFARAGVVHVFSDVPGMSPDDVSVYVYDRFMIIEGIKKENDARGDWEFIMLERRFPSFKRVFKLPFVAGKYEAVLRDGVLHVALVGDQTYGG